MTQIVVNYKGFKRFLSDFDYCLREKHENPPKIEVIAVLTMNIYLFSRRSFSECRRDLSISLKGVMYPSIVDIPATGYVPDPWLL